MEEVRQTATRHRPTDLTKNSKNLRGDVAMDVDEDEDGTQRPKMVHDYGIEVDFTLLEDDEKQVRDDPLV